MPARTDIRSILLIGAGPIVIGQACEFDYSGTQAIRALKEEGYRVILVNSNPATIMTDPCEADATYVEPLTWRRVEEIIRKEKPDALLPTMGGQTALNLALELDERGVLAMHGCELIGATPDAIRCAEDREAFRTAMDEIGLESPRSRIARSLPEAERVLEQIGLPCVIRPSFTLGGSGGGVAHDKQEFRRICTQGLRLSPTSELLIEESLLGWKEYELEVVRDRADNAIIVCAIENLDPMGVHTGDSITVAPPMTLTDRELQELRDAAIAVLRRIGVDTGGSNVQFAVNPRDGRVLVIEMNPRVSRSSALASKATGFPIARIAAKLAVGYTLDELRNQLTGGRTPASFEPALDYVVVKAPRFAFEKFPRSEAVLTTQMKSVGEAMALGGSFQEALQKALRSLENGLDGLDARPWRGGGEWPREKLARRMATPGPERILYVTQAFREGWPLEEVALQTEIDPWFLDQLEGLAREEQRIREAGEEGLRRDPERLRAWKAQGFSDSSLAALAGCSESVIRKLREKHGLHPVYKRVDTCAAEFPTETAYLYSTWAEECEANPEKGRKVLILGSGPNRIGQGVEFDTCCVHAAQALRKAGIGSLLVNCNPETVSTDVDTSDRLYFEPLRLEEVLEIVRVEQPEGLLIQYGGQTPLKMARELKEAGIPVLGTDPEVIDLCEDRDRFHALLQGMGVAQPAGGSANTPDEARVLAGELGFPLMVRPSYVLGGQAMAVIQSDEELQDWMSHNHREGASGPVLLDRYLEGAQELDVDLVCDGKTTRCAGILHHIEEAGIHSGDSACCYPPVAIDRRTREEIEALASCLALELGVVGLMNAQFVLDHGRLLVLEVNPRASRTVPFIEKARGIALAELGLACMLGQPLAEAEAFPAEEGLPVSVKQPVFPFGRFPGADPLLGPEMKSTGEVMGRGENFPRAFLAAALGGGTRLPASGNIFISVRDEDKVRVLPLAARLMELGYELLATRGTANALCRSGIPCRAIPKVNEGGRHIVDVIESGDVGFLINTTGGGPAIRDSHVIREAALKAQLPYTTALSTAEALLKALEAGHPGPPRPLQEL